jgi:putative RNA 2'-phosphotransferase
VDNQRRTRISKFMSLVLRHRPETAKLTLEPGGWVPIEALLTGAAAAGLAFTRDELEEVVERCDKQRFAIDTTDTKIRANQGHSTEVDLQLDPAEPPAELFHGTPDRNVAAVLRDGLFKMARHHVHLSPDVATAVKVGSRRGKPVILAVDAARMKADGITFYCSANGVWLVEHVPPRYLRVIEPKE